MIQLGYTLPSKKTLQHLMRKKDAGKGVPDTPWFVTSGAKPKAKANGDYNGIQSTILNKEGVANLKYCYGFGWFMNGPTKHWHAGGCSKDNVDKQGRCKCCRSAYRNLTKNRHTVLFKVNYIPTPKPASVPIVHAN